MKKLRIPLDKIKVQPDGIHLWLEIQADGLPENAGVIIDTGASQTIFDDNLMQKWLHEVYVPEEDHMSSGVSDYIEGQKFGLISGLSMGGFVFHDYPVGVMNLTHVQEIYQDQFNRLVCGLIGGDFLEKFNAILDYSESVLVISID